MLGSSFVPLRTLKIRAGTSLLAQKVAEVPFPRWRLRKLAQLTMQRSFRTYEVGIRGQVHLVSRGWAEFALKVVDIADSFWKLLPLGEPKVACVDTVKDQCQTRWIKTPTFLDNMNSYMSCNFGFA